MSDKGQSTPATDIDATLVEQLMWQIRRAFQDMARLGDRLHADLGLTAAKRTVLEALHHGGAQTVPAIARARNVSRQHIQQLADALVADGFAAFTENPAHRRSQLLSMTPKGSAAFSALRAREAAPVSEVAAALPAAQLKTCCETLIQFRDALAALDLPSDETAEEQDKAGAGRGEPPD